MLPGGFSVTRGIYCYLGDLVLPGGYLVLLGGFIVTWGI